MGDLVFEKIIHKAVRLAEVPDSGESIFSLLGAAKRGGRAGSANEIPDYLRVAVLILAGRQDTDRSHDLLHRSVRGRCAVVVLWARLG